MQLSEVEAKVAAHYGAVDLTGRILAALAETGHECRAASPLTRFSPSTRCMAASLLPQRSMSAGSASVHRNTSLMSGAALADLPATCRSPSAAG